MASERLRAVGEFNLDLEQTTQRQRQRAGILPKHPVFVNHVFTPKLQAVNTVETRPIELHN